ncbi:DUF4369 domain-containing protein [Xanthomarina sp. F1114]|uniref:DUF4369 domain-containing protein n=1 Tax=Xanthomarina sp. F1114 TaxID=2996019 RepID=UPI00225E5BE7|nr:DUF4369 domain-containing protein [Xanthomarina sp. F1114]MCX7547641.1 DUF4369 domain-containing protein [Xanthomarina sp. F1114]
MKKLFVLSALLFIVSCAKDPDLIVKGQVKGLKKGTVYLEKERDSALVIVDSMQLNNSSDFELKSELESPEAFYLRLDKNNSNDTDTRIMFFADKGVTQVNTTLKHFVSDAVITGSEQQKLYEEFLKVKNRYNNKKLDLIKESLEAKMEKDSAKIISTDKAFVSLVKSRYLYTVNFAVTNKDSEIAPYLALTEISDAQTKWLDTINNSLTPKVKASKYGKDLDVYLKERKSY